LTTAAGRLALHDPQPGRIVPLDNNYVVRTELPGMDPDKDIEITVEGGTLARPSSAAASAGVG